MNIHHVWLDVGCSQLVKWFHVLCQMNWDRQTAKRWSLSHQSTEYFPNFWRSFFCVCVQISDWLCVLFSQAVIFAPLLIWAQIPLWRYFREGTCIFLNNYLPAEPYPGLFPVDPCGFSQSQTVLCLPGQIQTSSKFNWTQFGSAEKERLIANP